MPKHIQRRHTRHRRMHSKTKLAVTATVITACFTAIGGIAMRSMGQEQPDANGCYARADQHKTAIFVDHSLQNLTDAQIRDYRTVFQRVYDAAPANGKISVFGTASHVNDSLAQPRFMMCKPAMTQDAQHALGAPEKPAAYLRRQAQQAKAAYIARVDTVLDELRNGENIAQESPILEQLRAISRSPDFTGKARRLAVISDGLQNSHLARFCLTQGDMPNFRSFKMRADYALNIKPAAWTDTSVSMLMAWQGALPSPDMPHCTELELKQWWNAYFTDNAAADIDINTSLYWGQ